MEEKIKKLIEDGLSMQRIANILGMERKELGNLVEKK